MKHQYLSYYLDSPLIPGRVFDLFLPEKVTKEIALFIVHGGGWRAGSRESFHPLMEAFSNAGYIVASTDYRLNAPTAVEQLGDVRAAYDRFISLLKEEGRPLQVAVYGTSAGAHLGFLLACAMPGACGEENHFVNEWVPPLCGIFQSLPESLLPWESMMNQTWSMFQDIAGVPYEKDPRRYRRLSPKSYVRSDNPPLFLMEAGMESMFPSAGRLEIMKKHRKFGIPSCMKIYTEMEHGFFYELRRRAQKEAFRDICRFMDGKTVPGALEKI